MRHAYLNHAGRAGVYERVAQQLAGHADSRITREAYTHATDRMLNGTADAADEH